MTTIDSSDIARAVLEDRAAVEQHRIMKAAIPQPRTRKATWESGIRRLLALGKTMPASAIDALDDALPEFNSDTADGIMGGYLNRVPSRAEIPVSPVTAASGGGAESLIGWSSDVTTQEGLTRLYNEFSKLLKRFDEMSKAQVQLATNVAEFVKSNARFPDSEDGDEHSSADEDNEEAEKNDKIGKALHGAGLQRSTIKEVLTLLSSSRHSPSPPDFAMHALRKASAQEVDFDSLTSEQLIRFQSAKQMLGAAANGANINHGLLDQAARVVANPAGEPSAYDIGAAAGRAGY